MLPIADKSHVRVIVLVTKEVEPKKVISPQPEDYVSKLAGLHKEIWQGIDTDNYLQQEREAWG
ncbi:transcriptional regulator, AbrB family [Beggiatoa sp. PS]|nr:transcriptional regulator, AbrB family [Beggiatoa sp. PS]